MPEPVLHELVNYVKLNGALAAAAHYEMGYSIVRRRIRSANVVLNRGRRRDKSLTPRNAQIRVQRMQGCYLIDIGRAFGLGRERVRQILAATGGDPLRPPEPHEPHEGGQETVQSSSVVSAADFFSRAGEVSLESLKAGVKTATSNAIKAVSPMPTQADATPATIPSSQPVRQPT